jgi:SNF2 family DNA or RNA helicase
VTEIEHQVELSAEETAIYESIRRAALEKLGNNSRGQGTNKLAILAELTKLRRLCCDARLVVPEVRIESFKLAAFSELMAELVSSGHRALVFSQFVDVLKLAGKALESSCKTYQYLDGSSSTKQRAAAVDAFQAGEGDAF